MRRDDFAGTGTLFRLFLKRDRFLFCIWILATFLLAVATAGTFGSMDLDSAIADLVTDPVISAMQGPLMSHDLAGVVIWRMMGLNVLILGIASIFTVVRHTRNDEEAGRSELIRAYVTGRYATLTAALLVALVINIIAGFMQTLLLIGIGAGVGGAVLFCLTVSAGGFFFAAIGSLGAQLRENTGGAIGISLIAVGLGFMLMIINNGNGGDTFLKWITPMAWHRLTRPLDDDYGWFILLFIIFTLIPMIAAFILSKKRDLGAGLIPPKLGLAEADPKFKSPLALAWRLHKGSFLTWLIGITIFGSGIGAIALNIGENEEFGNLLNNLGGMNWTEQIGNRDAFLAIVIYIIALVVGLYAITSLLKAYKEEIENRGELILSKPISKLKWLNSHLIITFFTSGLLMIAMGLGSGLIYGLSVGDFGNTFIKVFSMSVSKIPAVWFMAGITVFIYGFMPKVSTALSWAAWALFAALELLWEGGVINWKVMRFSPFSYAHYIIPVFELSWVQLVGLMIITILLTIIGITGFRRRDILSKA
ncbi:ABC transporter permease [Oceanobacillus jeddahense]|uniref:ABC transporter permease n=1 Tax=Oceanobacillus jeddahense TaxID=1462527 RepID=UPI000595AFCC|nr:hypothetical protein [Oceanobacillus jeddahense]